MVKLGQPGGMYTNVHLVGSDRTPVVFYFEPVSATLRAAACRAPLCSNTASIRPDEDYHPRSNNNGDLADSSR